MRDCWKLRVYHYGYMGSHDLIELFKISIIIWFLLRIISCTVRLILPVNITPCSPTRTPPRPVLIYFPIRWVGCTFSPNRCRCRRWWFCCWLDRNTSGCVSLFGPVQFTRSCHLVALRPAGCTFKIIINGVLRQRSTPDKGKPVLKSEI